MTSIRKQRANRQNATLSTGPRSVSGKQKSARNAWRHGLDSAVASGPDASAIALAEAFWREDSWMDPDGALDLAVAIIKRSRISEAKLREIRLARNRIDADPDQSHADVLSVIAALGRLTALDNRASRAAGTVRKAVKNVLKLASVL